MSAMRLRVERWCARMIRRPAPNEAASINLRRARPGKTAVHRRHDSPCDKASPALVVMLHLRSCYVSKAAILLIPVRSVPVENRSPA